MNPPSICPNRTNASPFKWARNVAQSITTTALGEAMTASFSAPIATLHNRANHQPCVVLVSGHHPRTADP